MTTFLHALGSEWTKLRSVRTTPFTLLAGAGLVVGLAGLLGRLGNPEIFAQPGGLTRLAFSGVLLGQIAPASVAVLAFTAEQESGSIRTTLAAVPRRGRLIAAKATVVGLASFAYGVVVSVAALSLLYAFVAARAATVEPLVWGTVFRPMVGNALYLGVFGVLAFGVGVLLRNTAGALTTLIGGAVIAPYTFSGLGEVGRFLGEWWPTSAGERIARVLPEGSGGLSPLAGFGVLFLATAIVLAFATLAFTRRDP
jgi:ABC-2 type transport system permease protein